MAGFHSTIASICVFSFGLSLVASTTLPAPVTAAPPSGCVHDGKTYAPMESFQPNPCEHCMCTPGGRTSCAISDCFFTPCVDAVHDPKRCCPQCPNGENCKAPDGTIIKKGDTYHPDANTECSCPSRFGWGTPVAMCAVRAVTLAVVS